MKIEKLLLPTMNLVNHSQKLYDTYTGIQSGKLEDKYGWRVKFLSIKNRVFNYLLTIIYSIFIIWQIDFKFQSAFKNPLYKKIFLINYSFHIFVVCGKIQLI